MCYGTILIPHQCLKILQKTPIKDRLLLVARILILIVMVESISTANFNKLLKRLDKPWQIWPLLMLMAWDIIITIDLNVKA
jgi:hypothetical protein